MSNFVGNKPNPLSLAIQGARKLITKVAQKTSGQKKTTGLEGIKYIKPSKKITLEGEKKKAVLKAKSDVQKKFGPVNEGVQKEVRNLRQSLQKLRKEPITPSGISKGSNLTPGIYESAAKGRKKLKFGGVSTKKSNVQKIKETFGPGKSNPKKSAAKKKKFPDLTGDGKVTFADILKGRGVKRG